MPAVVPAVVVELDPHEVDDPTLAARVAGMRARAEAKMIDRCLLLGDPERTQDETYDEATLTLVPGPDDPVVLWPTDPGDPGRCLVNYSDRGRGERDEGTEVEYLVALPWYLTPMPLVGQWVQITESAVLPGMDGEALTITEVDRGSLAPYVRLRATLVTRREVAPGG